jgi:hypothetical protein
MGGGRGSQEAHRERRETSPGQRQGAAETKDHLQLIDQEANLGLIRDIAEEVDEPKPVRFPGWHGQRTHVQPQDLPGLGAGLDIEVPYLSATAKLVPNGA